MSDMSLDYYRVQSSEYCMRQVLYSVVHPGQNLLLPRDYLADEFL